MKRAAKAFFLSVLMGTAGVAWATPSNTPVLDGRPSEYDATDLRATYTGGGGAFGAGTYITNLYVTWDTNYLYVALQGAEVNDKLVVLLDVDPGNGTGAGTTTNWTGVTPDYIRYNDIGWQVSTNAGAAAFGLDFQVASEGFYNNIVGIVYDGIVVPTTNNTVSLFDSGNGASPLGTPVDMTVQSDATACELKGIEARIPWSVLYPTNNRFGVMSPDQTVPTGAVIRLLAMIHNNNPAIAYSSNDAIPQQTSPNASYVGGLLTSDTYLDVTIDGDNDAQPDVAPGDANAPYIRYASGVAGNRQVYVQFNEPVDATAASDTNSWTLNGVNPSLATPVSTNAVVLEAASDLPAAGNLVVVDADGISDNAANFRLSSYCMSTAASGLTNALTVRFVLEAASGLGVNPGATNFFINGGSFPLEFGYPPSEAGPLSVLSGSLHYRDVTFPPGTPQTLNYKFSGRLTATGTNTYEIVRLSDYANASRKLTLPLDQSSLTITDYLGAAGGPYRTPGSNTAYSALYVDAQRGDAGVRQRVTMKFQLDLSQRNRDAVSRVLVQGSDPLRGFNVDGTLPNGVSDWAGGGAVGWNNGGIQLVDDGTLGDTNANDGIYARDWSFTVDGTDADFVAFPGSLVGGSFGDVPYAGSGWVDGRSPRSVGYKYYVLKSDTSVVETPGANIEIYLEATDTRTNIVLAPYLWDNDGLPPPPPSNSPVFYDLRLTNGTAIVQFTNEVTETQHGVQISTNLLKPWLDYGHRASTSSPGFWQASITNLTGHEVYRPFAGVAQGFQGVRFSPNPLDSTGGTLRIYYNQHSRGLAGDRNVQVAGSFTTWNPQPMTFLTNGVWYFDAAVGAADATNIEFKPRSVAVVGTVWEGMGGGGDNYRAYKGVGRATWTPNSPTNLELLTITYNAAGGPLAASPNVNAYVGFEEQWYDAGDRNMTNIGGTTWELAFPVPSNRSLSVNWVFNNRTNGVGGIWDSETTTGGRLYRAFIGPNPYP